jgi:hypothetical protein
VISSGSGTSTVTVTTSSTVPTPGGEWSEGFIGTSGAITHETYTGLTVKNVPQTINFPPLPNVVYGTAPIFLQATAGSNLAVTYTVSGPAAVTGGATLLGPELNITGAGIVTVTANQSGGSYYSAAPAVVQKFTVLPAVLTVTAQNATITSGAALPTFTSSISGFVNGDTSSVVSGAASVSTTASAASPEGTYPIDVSQGTLTAANYTFAFVDGTLYVVQAPTVSITAAAPLTQVSGGYQAAVTVTNTGSAAAANVQLITATLGASTGSPLPLSFGTLAAGGGSNTVTVTFPASSGNAGATVAEKYTWTYTGGTFAYSIRGVTLP